MGRGRRGDEQREGEGKRDHAPPLFPPRFPNSPRGQRLLFWPIPSLSQGLLGITVPLLTGIRGQRRDRGDSSPGEPTWLVAWISSWAFARLARLASSILKRSAVTARGGQLRTRRSGVDTGGASERHLATCCHLPPWGPREATGLGLRAGKRGPRPLRESHCTAPPPHA